MLTVTMTAFLNQIERNRNAIPPVGIKSQFKFDLERNAQIPQRANQESEKIAWFAILRAVGFVIRMLTA